MRTLHTFVVATLVACGGGGGKAVDALIIIPDTPIDVFVPDAPPDAQQLDLSCANNPAPTTATATVVISGTANGLELNGTQPSVAPLTSATINACKANCQGQNKLDTQTTAASGCPNTGCPFTTNPLPTLTMPLDGYLRAAKQGFITSNTFPPQPITADTMNVPLLAFSTGAFQGLQLLAGVNQDATKGAFVLVFTDCAGTPINGVTPTLKQNGTDITASTNVIDASAFSSMAQGTFFVFNVPAGDTEVGGSVQGTTLRAHTILSVANQTSATQVTPGFAN